MALTPEQARAMGKRSGAVRRGITTDMIAALPPLDTEQHIREYRELVGRWAADGLLSPGIASALVRNCDGAARDLKELRAAQIDLGVIRKLEQRVRELEAELAEARRAPRR